MCCNGVNIWQCWNDGCFVSAEIPSTQSLLTVDTLRSSDDIELAEKLRIEQALNDL